MAQNEVIPFGKYKGRDVEEIAGDKQYIDWLCAQSWFREKHVHLYQVIINNFTVPQDTPEHNKLQAAFLDNRFCGRLLWHLGFGTVGVGNAVFESQGIDVQFDMELLRIFEYRDGKTEELRSGSRVAVEIKPTLSDDYPTVLRQICRYECQDIKILVIGSFHSSVITYDQLRDIFNRSGIYVVLFDDI